MHRRIAQALVVVPLSAALAGGSLLPLVGDTPTAAQAAAYTVKGAIGTKYQAAGGASTLGEPTMNERAITGGAYQEFKKGADIHRISWSSATGAQIVKINSGIGGRYKQSGYEAGLGFPTASERATSDGGAYQNFKKGNDLNKVMWSSATGAYSVRETGPIGQHWKSLDFERGLGYPMTNEATTTSGVLTQKFKKGDKVTTVNWTAARGIWTPTTEVGTDAFNEAILTGINDLRKANKLAPVEYSRSIAGISLDESERMISERSNTSSGNYKTDPRAGYWKGASEISSIRTTTGVDTKAIVDSWKNSPAHRAILLDPETDVVGIGVSAADRSNGETGTEWGAVAVLDSYDYYSGREPWDAAATVATSGASPFKDVTDGTAFRQQILWTSTNGIFAGWSESDGTKTFRPAATTGRYAMAAALYRLAGSPDYTPPSTSKFRDVKPSNGFYKEIMWAAEKGYMDGDDAGYFRSSDPVTREDVATSLYRVAGSPEFTVEAGTEFADVNSNHPAYKEIHWMRSEGITNGFSDNTFRAGNSTIRADMSAFLYRYMHQY